nr:2B protein [parechovirus C1]
RAYNPQTQPKKGVRQVLRRRDEPVVFKNE